MVTPVDPAYASWLKDVGLYTSATDATLAARWGEDAAQSETISPLALRAAADAEAARQLDFMSGPLVRDEHVVQGLRHDLLGKSIRLIGVGLGYEAPGAVVFVIRVQESETTDTTALVVLRRLA